jgi:hypothetical protein
VLALAVALVASGAAAPAGGGVAANVTLSARPTNLSPSQIATLFGAVDSGEANQTVTIETKDCLLRSFTEVAVTETTQGGNFTLTFAAGVNTTVRAVWRSATSAPVEIRQQPRLQLERRSARRFEIGIPNRGQMWRKKVTIQRRSGGKWVAVKTVTLTKTAGGAGRAFVWTSAEFRLSVRRGTVIRAVLPAAQARPCYLTSTSNTVRS